MLAWKPNWEESRQHFIDWWNHEGLLLGSWGMPRSAMALEDVAEPMRPASIEECYRNAEYRAQHNHHWLAHGRYPGDILPISSTDIGPGSLALYLGSEAGISPETVWFNPLIQHVEYPEALPPLQFDPLNAWWQVTEATAKACMALARGKYLVGFPDLVENIDILASLREPETLLFDMLERPEWVATRVREINQVYFEVYQRLYDIIKLEDGSSCYGAFCIWGPGKTAKIQCDASAMFSPVMFEEFAVPGLTEQCAWLDHSLYHLDGTQAMQHLDHLLRIESLDAIEWTPQAGIEDGGSPRWFPLYHRILDAGKSVQIIVDSPDEIPALLKEIGSKGVYVMAPFESAEQMAQTQDRISAYC